MAYAVSALGDHKDRPYESERRASGRAGPAIWRVKRRSGAKDQDGAVVAGFGARDGAIGLSRMTAPDVARFTGFGIGGRRCG